MGEPRGPLASVARWLVGTLALGVAVGVVATAAGVGRDGAALLAGGTLVAALLLGWLVAVSTLADRAAAVVRALLG